MGTRVLRSSTSEVDRGVEDVERLGRIDIERVSVLLGKLAVNNSVVQVLHDRFKCCRWQVQLKLARLCVSHTYSRWQLLCQEG